MSLKRDIHKILPYLFMAGRPFSLPYAGGMKLRALAYGKGILSRRKLPCPVISVGNITMGGTGKTPHVIAVSKWLREQGIRPAVCTRGYGGKAGKGPLVVSNGERICATVSEAGDEPVMMAERLRGVVVIAGSDRCLGGTFAIERFGVQAIVLDDGFQHLRLERDVDLVLLSAQSPFGTGRVFPGGDLREPLSALSRSSALVLTGVEKLSLADQEIIKCRVQETVPGKPVFLSRVRPTVFSCLGTGRQVSPSQVRKSKVVAFCAIGSPEGFFHTIKGMGMTLLETMSFPDHYRYTSGDLVSLFKKAEEAGADALVTTAKDGVKLKAVLSSGVNGYRGPKIPIWQLEIEADPDEGLWQVIRKGFVTNGIDGFRNHSQEIG